MRVRVYEDDHGEFRWTRLADNNRKVATSGEGFESRAYAITSARMNFPDDEIEHAESGPMEERLMLSMFALPVFASLLEAPLDNVVMVDGNDKLMQTPPQPEMVTVRIGDELMQFGAPPFAQKAPIVVPYKGEIKPTSPPSIYVQGIKRALKRAGYLYVAPGSSPTPNAGAIFWTALAKFCRKKGIKVEKRYTEAMHRALVQTPAAGKPGEWAFDPYGGWLVGQYQPKSLEDRQRELIVANALYAVSVRDLIGYMQIRPMIDMGPPPNVPNLMDCSTSHTWYYKSAKAPDPNGRGYDGWGNTDTLLAHGRSVLRAQVKLADAAFYFDPDHVITLVGDGRGVSHGSWPGPYLVGMDYRGAPRSFRTFAVR